MLVIEEVLLMIKDQQFQNLFEEFDCTYIELKQSNGNRYEFINLNGMMTQIKIDMNPDDDTTF